MRLPCPVVPEALMAGCVQVLPRSRLCSHCYVAWRMYAPSLGQNRRQAHLRACRRRQGPPPTGRSRLQRPMWHPTWSPVSSAVHHPSPRMR